MSDIDFDELDRAVNGAIEGNASTTQPSEETPAQESDAPSEPITETPTIEHVERTQLNPTAAKAPAPSAPAVRRSSGRFMDIVHPSSDMRSPSNSAPLPTKLGATLLAPVPQPVAEKIVDDAPSWNEPLESPFLPDAKVEKRPLGGTGEVTAAAPAGPLASFDFQGLLDEPEEELLEAPESQELIAADTLPDPIDFAATTSPVAEGIESKPYEDDVTAETKEINAVESPEVIQANPEQAQPVQEDLPQVTPEEPVGPTSITPQYKEQPSSNQESGAIFDTESYHQAVVAPVKKRSGWVTLIWIIVLILLGAAAGWAVYTYVLPMIT